MEAELQHSVQIWLIRVRNSLVLLAAAALISCSIGPKKENELLAPLRLMGADLPVRRTELIAKCHLEDVPSTRRSMGLRGGWGGIVETWSLPYGGEVVAKFNIYSGGFTLVKTHSHLSPNFDANYSSPKIPAETWFNGLGLLDTKGRILYSHEKLPPVKDRGGKKLPDSRDLL